MSALRALGVLVLTLPLACSAPVAPPLHAAPAASTAAPQVAKAPAREQPPPSGARVDLRLPTPVWADLPQGLSLATVERRGLPLVQIRVVVRAGSAVDGVNAGLAALTADLLKESGSIDLPGDQLLARAAELGSPLTVETGFDHATVGLTVLRDDLPAALRLLGAMIVHPRLAKPDFERLRGRRVAIAVDTAHEDGDWAASLVLFRDLFHTTSGRSSYARWDALDTDLTALDLAQCRDFHRRYYVPSRTFVVIAGDTTAAETRPLVEDAFRGYRGAPPPPAAEPPPASAPLRITVIDHPGALQSNIYTGSLGPSPADPRYPALAVMNRILGGKGTGRLFLDVREKRALAYLVKSTITELAVGPSVVSLVASTKTESTALTVQAFLEHANRLGHEAPTEDEGRVAAGFLAEDVGAKTDTLAGIADSVVRARAFGLPDDALAAHRRALLQATPASVAAVASDVFGKGLSVISVRGDAAVIAPLLARFGEVTVVDPLKSFTTVRTVAHTPSP